MSFRRFASLVTTVACALLLWVGPADAQETGTLTGQVTAAATGQPLAGVQVFIENSTVGTLTNANGRYLMTSAPAGERRVTALLIGFGTTTVDVNIVVGGSTVLDFALSQTAIALDEVVVTATGAQRKREIGNTVATVQAAEVVELTPITNAFDLLQARAPGVQVMNAGGTVGAGSRIRIRGSNSISLSNEPIIYVDGIRLESGDGQSIGLGGQDMGRLNDINPEDIESIEIVKGPSAATLYGTQAANGVIRITTKKGQAGPALWTLYMEGGAVNDPYTYPDNWRAEDSSGSSCRLDAQAAGTCSVANLFNYTPLEDDRLSPLGQGWRQQYGMNVTGGTERINYFISSEWEQEVGPYDLKPFYADQLTNAGFDIDETVQHPQRLERISVRANITAQVAENAVLALRTGYVTSDVSMTGNDNNSFGVLPSGYFGGAKRPENNSDSGDGINAYGFQTPDQLFRRDLYASTERFMTSANFTWAPMNWLDVRATGGVDFMNRHDQQHIPRNLVMVSGRGLGDRDSNFRRYYQYTMDAGATATYDLSPEIRTKTAVGFQFLRDFVNGTDATGQDIVTGSRSLASAAAQFGVDETTTESRSLGLFIEEQVSYADRFFLTGAIRMDDNTAFGKDFEAIVYPKLSASWLMSEEDWFPEFSFLDQFRIRSAWGMSGLQPATTAAIRTLDAVAITAPDGSDMSGVTMGGIGNVELKPEKAQELEGGFDADMLEGRLGLEVTGYWKETKDALISRQLPPSFGASANRWENLASVRNIGLEVAISTTPIETDYLTWSVNLAGSINENEVMALGEGVEPIGTTVKHIEGYPAGGIWEKPIVSWSDANGDGVLGRDEIEVGDEYEYVGPGMPTREVSLSSSVTLWDRIRIYGLFDYRGDYVLYNNTERFRCNFSDCRALQDPSTPMWDQARAVANRFHSTPTTYGYREDASFLKFREMSLSFFVPQEWAQRLNASRAVFTITGRNLHTWTDYTGVDPELNSGGSSTNFGTSDFLTQPPLRYFTARLTLNF